VYFQSSSRVVGSPLAMKALQRLAARPILPTLFLIVSNAWR
jgi:hypothetical protein